MDNRLNIDEITNYTKSVKEMFKEATTADIYDLWADTFEIEYTDSMVSIIYYGAESIKLFKKDCRDILVACINIAIGEGRKVIITQNKNQTVSAPKKEKPAKSYVSNLSPKVKKNIKAVKFFVIGMIFVCIATAIIVIMCNYIGNRSFKETFYNVSSIKVDSPVRVIQISDLHGVSYGKNNKKLIERVSALKPDIILLTGDIVDSATEDLEYAENLAKSFSEIAPSYYIYGNNEAETIYDVPLTEEDLDKKFGFTNKNRDVSKLSQIKDTFEEKLEKRGIKVLKNEMDTIEVKTMTIDVYGVLNSNPSSFWSYSGGAFESYSLGEPENIKITAVHEPFIFEEFSHDYWGDLLVTGHTHGGVVRVPMLGPLYTHEGGLFPDRGDSYVYGRYDVSGSPLIVSGGLENKNVFRINNQPELVVIDVNKF